MTFGRWLAALAVTLAIACKHGQADDPALDHGAGAAAEKPALSITKWTDRYELFVELPPPVPGKPVRYHAHVTRLDGFAPVTEGTLRFRFKTQSGVATEATQAGVERPGVFAFESPAPPAGTYQLEVAYEHGGQVDVVDGGPIHVKAGASTPAEDAAGGEITLSKESQWKIPFGTAWAETRPIARELELAATVEPASGDQLTVGASITGRFFHNPKLALAEGLRVAKGDVLGTIAPNVAGEDYSRLQFDVEEARLRQEQLEREIARVEPLVRDGLLPERRLLELQNELQTETARRKSAGERLGRVLAPGGRGGVTIKSTQGGLVSQVLVPNGEPVEAGAPLVRIGGTDHVWLRARFVTKPASLLRGAVPTGVRQASGERLDLQPLGARFLSTLPVVDAASRIATWIVDVPPSPAAPASAADLRPGGTVVLSIRVGEPRTVLAVPRSAVVELSTRPYLFVQTGGERFEKRPVTLGDSDGPWIEVRAGVKPGERIVTQGGFDIHLAALMGTIESDHH